MRQVTQQERLKLLTRLFQRIAGSLAGSHQVSDRLVSFIRNRDRGQFARAVQARQADGIPGGWSSLGRPPAWAPASSKSEASLHALKVC